MPWLGLLPLLKFPCCLSSPISSEVCVHVPAYGHCHTKREQEATSAAPPPVFHYLSFSPALTPSSLPNSYAGQLAPARVSFSRLRRSQQVHEGFFVIVWDFVRVRWCFTGRERALGSLFSLCHNPLIAARHGASSDHPGSSSGRSCSPEGARLFWSPLSRHHWCSGCWPGAPRSQVWTPGLPAVPSERAWAGCWSPGLEQGHTSTWCCSYWQHPGAAVACARRRLQHWGKYIHS